MNATGGANAPPQRPKAHITAWALTRSDNGNQADSIRVRLGKQPASPAPNRKRTSQSDTRFHAAPVSAVKTDQINTNWLRTQRTPSLSPRSPIGISNRA